MQTPDPDEELLRGSSESEGTGTPEPDTEEGIQVSLLNVHIHVLPAQHSCLSIPKLNLCKAKLHARV